MNVLTHEERPVAKWTFAQVLAALSVSVASIVMGFSLAYTGTFIETLGTLFAPNVIWVGTLLPLVTIAGSLAGGLIIEYVGRKNTIIAAVVPFIISWLIIGCATSLSMVVVGRAISAFCSGIASMSLPVYLVETIQPKFRGTLGIIPAAFMNIGIVVCFVSKLYKMNWSMMAFLGGGLSMLSLVLMLLIPETPRWYISRGHEDRARKALEWLNGNEADVEPEFQGIMRAHINTEKHTKNNIFLELLKWNNLKPLFISMGLIMFQHLCGINTVVFFSIQILQDVGVVIDWNFFGIILDVIALITTIFAAILIDRIGRKVLLYISNIAIIGTLFVMGGYFYARHNEIDVSQIGWLIVASYVIFIIGFALGFGPIPLLIMGEILPAKIRGPAAGVAMAFHCICANFVINVSLQLVDLLSIYGVFWINGSISCIAFLFVRFCVPETKGKTLENIEHEITGRERTISSEAKIYPQLLSA